MSAFDALLSIGRDAVKGIEARIAGLEVALAETAKRADAAEAALAEERARVQKAREALEVLHPVKSCRCSYCVQILKALRHLGAEEAAAAPPRARSRVEEIAHPEMRPRGLEAGR